MNLCDEITWIPVVYHDGTTAHLTLRDTLLQADDIYSIWADTPVEAAAINRVVIACAVAAHRPWTTDKASHIAEHGLDTSAITEYLDTWRHRFELVDSPDPFMQTPDVYDTTYNSMAVLDNTRARGNNKLLHDHTRASDHVAYDAAKTARLLITIHAADSGGIKGSPQPADKKDPLRSGFDNNYSGKFGPLANNRCWIVRGLNLAQTIAINLPPELTGPGDAPCWERPTRQIEIPDAGTWKPARRDPTGALDMLTWQARTITLRLDGDMFTAVARNIGDTYSKTYMDDKDGTGQDPLPDPMLWQANRHDKKKEAPPRWRALTSMGRPRPDNTNVALSPNIRNAMADIDWSDPDAVLVVDEYSQACDKGKFLGFEQQSWAVTVEPSRTCPNRDDLKERDTWVTRRLERMHEPDSEYTSNEVNKLAAIIGNKSTTAKQKNTATTKLETLGHDIQDLDWTIRLRPLT